jgi:hypothetical protein
MIETVPAAEIQSKDSIIGNACKFIGAMRTYTLCTGLWASSRDDSKIKETTRSPMSAMQSTGAVVDEMNRISAKGKSVSSQVL